MVAAQDWLLLSAQGMHQLGAVAWVGGSIFYKFVLQRSFRKAGTDSGSIRAIGHEFGRIVRIAIVILVITGAFMAVVHLSAGGNSRAYIAILALKIALAFYMFLVAWLIGRRQGGTSSDSPASGWAPLRRIATGTTTLLALGVVVIGLADVLGAVGGHEAHGHGSGGHSREEMDDTHAETGAHDHHDSHEEDIEDSDGEGGLTDDPGVGGVESHDHSSDGHDDDGSDGHDDDGSDGHDDDGSDSHDDHSSDGHDDHSSDGHDDHDH